jgi:hypothetical protein
MLLIHIGPGLEIREYGRRDPSRWPSGTPLSAKIGISFADKRRSLGRIVRSQIQATELFLTHEGLVRTSIRRKLHQRTYPTRRSGFERLKDFFATIPVASDWVTTQISNRQRTKRGYSWFMERKCWCSWLRHYAEKSRVRLPMKSFDFSITLILPPALWPLG